MLKVMESVTIADQLRELQAYGQQRTAEAAIDPTEIPAHVQGFLKLDAATLAEGNGKTVR